MRIRTSEYVTEFARFHAARGRAEGKAEAEAEGEVRGMAKGLLMILAARGIELTTEQKRRIECSTSLADLDKWLRQAATAHSAEEVFA